MTDGNGDPKPRIVGVECNRRPVPGSTGIVARGEHGKLLVVDFHDLKFMPVQMHGMRRRRLIDEDRSSTRSPLAMGGCGGVSLVQATLLRRPEYRALYR